jgi:hypothetical protein
MPTEPCFELWAYNQMRVRPTSGKSIVIGRSSSACLDWWVKVETEDRVPVVPRDLRCDDPHCLASFLPDTLSLRFPSNAEWKPPSPLAPRQWRGDSNEPWLKLVVWERRGGKGQRRSWPGTKIPDLRTPRERMKEEESSERQAKVVSLCSLQKNSVPLETSKSSALFTSDSCTNKFMFWQLCIRAWFRS